MLIYVLYATALKAILFAVQYNTGDRKAVLVITFNKNITSTDMSIFFIEFKEKES